MAILRAEHGQDSGDRYLPDAMLNTERWFNGHIRYEIAVPNGWDTVLLYFSENYPPGQPRTGRPGLPDLRANPLTSKSRA